MKYKEYGNIYTDYCVECLREGMPSCKLEYKDGKCVNFVNLEDLKRKF